MKNYTITVNGTVYDVTVEDKGGSGVSPVSAPAPKAAAAPAAPAGAGAIKIEAGAAGKVVKVAASAGTAVKKGDAVVVLEVMKMETPVVAPEDGTVASINCNEGQTVEAGALLATMNK
ncbi:MAG: acetyl-CoA carboxylase biotin carboxyl carrier protein subunit [Pseudobutyrivibrio sp.]|nr:acetyl-CoA carboxylase biotin carboxyl carrier protein subunit [Pseudobutyrivibrio sp.]